MLVVHHPVHPVPVVSRVVSPFVGAELLFGGDGSAVKPALARKSAGYREASFTRSYALTYRHSHPDVLFLGGGTDVYWRHYLEHRFPYAVVDARAGRSFLEYGAVYRKISAWKSIRRIRNVVVSFPDNDTFSDGALRHLLSAIGKHRTVYVIPSGSAERQLRRFLVESGGQYPNVVSVDFAGLASRNPEYRYSPARGITTLSYTGIRAEMSLFLYTAERHYFGAPVAGKSPAAASVSGNRANTSGSVKSHPVQGRIGVTNKPSKGDTTHG